MNRTACYDWHVQHGARMVDFAGWEMPVQYSTITEEHHAVRKRAGLFDIAHMGRLHFTGPDQARLLDRLVTTHAGGIPPGRIRYALVTNESGGIIDDVLVYRLAGSFLMVVNASNRLKMLDWIGSHIGTDRADVADQTAEQCMLALQGPIAERILAPLVNVSLSRLRYYHGIETTLLDSPAIISRTGYTGEDGFEMILPASKGVLLWERLNDAGAPHGLKPAGLGCRDTLRLEAAMPLYGHEIDEAVDPFAAGLGFAVDLESHDFIGKDALIAARAKPDHPRRVGLVLKGRRIARDGAQVFSGNRNVGRVTSGTFSPTLEKGIALAYVAQPYSAEGCALDVDVRGRREEATVVKLPFYRRP